MCRNLKIKCSLRATFDFGKCQSLSERHSLACALLATRATCGALWPELLALSASISLGAAMGVPYFTNIKADDGHLMIAEAEPPHNAMCNL